MGYNRTYSISLQARFRVPLVTLPYIQYISVRKLNNWPRFNIHRPQNVWYAMWIDDYYEEVIPQTSMHSIKAPQRSSFLLISACTDSKQRTELDSALNKKPVLVSVCVCVLLDVAPQTTTSLPKIANPNPNQTQWRITIEISAQCPNYKDNVQSC